MAIKMSVSEWSGAAAEAALYRLDVIKPSDKTIRKLLTGQSITGKYDK